MSRRNDLIPNAPNCAKNNPPWPASSPDLSPLDFALWSQLRRLVYKHPLPSGEAEWRARIDESLEEISSDQPFINKVCDSVLKRAHECRLKSGAHFEHQLRRRGQDAQESEEGSSGEED